MDVFRTGFLLVFGGVCGLMAAVSLGAVLFALLSLSSKGDE